MRRTITTWMLGALLLVGLAAGCGAPAAGDDVASAANNGGAAGTTTTTQDPQDALVAFAQCMRDHGVDMADPTVNADGGVIMKGPTGANPDKMKEADTACAALRPKAGDGGKKPDPEQEQKMKDAALAFTACMRDHGIDVPDPEFSDGGMSMKLGEGNNADDPAFKAAQSACESLMPKPGGDGGVTSDGGAGGDNGPSMVVGGGSNQ
jgi:hypothetical protein